MGSAWLMLVGIVSFVFKTAFTCIEDYSILEILVPGLTVCIRSFYCIWSCILAWARYFKLKTLSVEYLVVVESWRGCIEPYFLSSICFVVIGSCLLSPLRPLVQIRNYSAGSNSSGIVTDVHTRWTC